jgi:Binding-protein-dependent transport system inner membrane component
VAIIGPGLHNLVIALAVTGWVVYAQLVRGEALSLREREFVLSARGLGASRLSVMVRRRLPAQHERYPDASTSRQRNRLRPRWLRWRTRGRSGWQAGLWW